MEFSSSQQSRYVGKNQTLCCNVEMRQSATLLEGLTPSPSTNPGGKKEKAGIECPHIIQWREEISMCKNEYTENSFSS